MKLLCKGQYPRGVGSIIFPELKFRDVQAGEIIEVDATMCGILLKKYPHVLSEVKDEPIGDIFSEEKKITNKKDKRLPANPSEKDFA